MSAEFISSFATGLTTPTPTISVDVASRTILGEMDVQPPAEDPPIVVTVPQVIWPEPSVWRLLEELLQFRIVLTRRLEPTVTFPEVFNVPAAVLNVPIPSPPVRNSLPFTESAVTGEVDPMPTLPELFQMPVLPAKYALLAMVKFVVEAFVAVRAVAVVVARVVVPVTARVPFEVNDDVAVIEPAVSELIVPVTAFSIEV